MKKLFALAFVALAIISLTRCSKKDTETPDEKPEDDNKPKKEENNLKLEEQQG